MKIYIASSWKNEKNAILIANYLRDNGHEVDCFCDESSGRFVFHWSEIGDLLGINAINFLENEKAQKAFLEDKKWIDWSEIVIMLLPCGNSSHLEAGYAKGSGKKLIIVGEFPNGNFDVMYGFADKLIKIDEIELLIEELKKANHLIGLHSAQSHKSDESILNMGAGTQPPAPSHQEEK